MNRVAGADATKILCFFAALDDGVKIRSGQASAVEQSGKRIAWLNPERDALAGLILGLAGEHGTGATRQIQRTAIG